MAVGLTGCVTYQPGSFAKGVFGFLGEKTTVGCLDLSIHRRADYDKSAVLAYRFGNRCETPQTVDLGAARVIGRDAAGGEHVLRPFDPRAEIRPLAVDARLTGGEAIAYVADGELGVDLVQVCVDAASIVPGAERQQWMCFATRPPVDEPPAPDPAADPEADPEEPALVHEEAA